MNSIIDTHAHYDDKAFDDDRTEILMALKAAGVETVINSGADLNSSKRSLELASEYDFVYASVGVHPDSAGEVTDEALASLETLLKNPRAVAVGEIGLDYHWDVWPREVQREAFLKQWELALSADKPIVIHSRDAAEDTMKIVKEMFAREKHLRADMHCYSYSAEQAEEYCRMGLFFGVGGVVTFKNARKLREVVEAVPMERILLETDCPYLAPEPVRGSRNTSANLMRVAEEIAGIKGISVQEVIDITCVNAKTFFNL